jgi:hypothetical protein
MCWSGEASAVLATVGLGTTVYAAYRKEPPTLWMALGYFSLMEALQAFTYTVVGQCELPSNQIATLLGYLHIAFQPFFVNAVSMHFIPAERRQWIQPYVYALCFVSCIFMLIQLYPFAWAGQCDPGNALCGTRLCSVRGNWHIAWELPVNGICNGAPEFFHGFPTYILASFVLPLLYGSWRLTTFNYLMGPFLAQLTTDNPNEWPAVWCLFSIAFLLIVMKSPLRRFMYVRAWPRVRFVEILARSR